MRKARHFGILLGKALGGVNENDAHPRALYRGQRADDAVALYPVLYFAAPAQARGVNEGELAVLVVHVAVHCVARGAGLVGHNHALFAQNIVHEAGFAHIRPPNYRHGDALVVLRHLCALRQMRAHGLQHVARAVPVHRRDGVHLAQAQRVKIVQFQRRRAQGIHLVHHQQHGLARAQQHGGNFPVLRGDARADVGDK